MKFTIECSEEELNTFLNQVNSAEAEFCKSDVEIYKQLYNQLSNPTAYEPDEIYYYGREEEEEESVGNLLKKRLEALNPNAAAQVEEQLDDYLASTDMLQHHIDNMIKVHEACKKHGVIAGIVMETPIEIHGTLKQLQDVCADINGYVESMNLADDSLDIEVL